MVDTFRTLAGPVEAEPPKTKGSRFIADAFPVADADEAAACLEGVRHREAGATHHCWAWRLGIDGAVTRSSDDGEPSGTAGAPILRQIEAHGLTDVIVVVTRYYGGTKLGTGGLIRAYGEAARLVLDAAPVVERVRQSALWLRFAYDDTAAAMQVLHRFGADVSDQRYTDVTELTVRVRQSQAAQLADALVEALGGRGVVEVLG